MCEIGAGKLAPDRAVLWEGVGRFLLVDDGRLRGLRFQPVRQRAFIGQCFTRRPFCALAQRLQGSLGAILGFADDTHKIAVAHNRDQAGDAARAILRKADEFCS